MVEGHPNSLKPGQYSLALSFFKASRRFQYVKEIAAPVERVLDRKYGSKESFVFDRTSNSACSLTSPTRCGCKATRFTCGRG